MRIAIISDIHGNLLALEAVLKDIDARKPDLTINLGDCVSGPFWPKETFNLLQDLDVPTVRGNHDRWLLERSSSEINPGYNHACSDLTNLQKQRLGNLPSRLHFDGDVFAFHGTPDNDTQYLLEDKVDGRLALASAMEVHKRIGEDRKASLYLCGHSHLAHVAQGPKGSTIINPGSVGCPRFTDLESAFEAENGIALAHYAIATKTNKRWSVELIALDYNWSQVAQQAKFNGYPTWAQVFE